MQNKKDFQYLLSKNESGVAMLMTLSAITILSLLLASFTFETKLNKIKIYNLQDKFIAKNNARAGLSLALAKLRLYQEARNALEKNKNLKTVVQPGQIEEIATQPFFFPIPTPPKAGLILKNALQEFAKATVLEGSISLSTSPISGFLNPNNLRIGKKKEEKNPTSSTENKEDDAKNAPHIYIEKKLIKTLQDLVDKQIEKDEVFASKYSNINVELLIKELKFFVNNTKDFTDPEKAEIEAIYLSKDIIPKHAPLTSIDEMYLLEGWDDAIVDLLKDRLTAHEVSIIQINKINESELKIIFPDITPIQVEEFFKTRDGHAELNIKPKPFKSVKDFQDLIVELGVLEATAYKDRIKEFEDAGLKLGVAGKLFKVISEGAFGRSRVKIIAFVDLPIKDPPPPPPKDQEKDTGNIPDPSQSPADPNKPPEPPPEELMRPRVIEIRL